VSLVFDRTHWALILGGSSGFGLATARGLARRGMNVAIAHRDRRGAMPAIEREFQDIRETGVGFLSVNVDALATEGRASILEALAAAMGDRGRVRLLMHSIAFGNLKPIAPVAPATQPVARTRARLAEALGVSPEALGQAIQAVANTGGADALYALCDPPDLDPDLLLEEEDFARTVHAMGTSLAAYTQALFSLKLFAADARVLAMTSEGNEVAWRGYAAVSAAKAALESVSRSIAREFGPHGVRSNIVQAGITDTPALRLIPGSDGMKADARVRNPLGRLTTPDDVADVICLLCTDEARWMNGSIVRVDGGERIAR
jgi:NAD(P)-dependent dehydrogenase (short-subunit alcohol dehydrogenase family)